VVKLKRFHGTAGLVLKRNWRPRTKEVLQLRLTLRVRFGGDLQLPASHQGDEEEMLNGETRRCEMH